MAKRKRNRVDYRRLKKMLNPYYTFNFAMPRKGKDFTPAQKSLLTRRYRKIQGVLENLEDNTFFKFSSGKRYSSIDGLRTNKGIFAPVAKAKIYRDEKGKYVVVSRIGEFVRQDFYFPHRVIRNPALIEPWVKSLEKKYEPYGILWARYGTSDGTAYDPQIFYIYFSVDRGNEFEDKNLDNFDAFLESPGSIHGEKIGSIVGVSLYYEKESYTPVKRKARKKKVKRKVRKKK